MLINKLLNKETVVESAGIIFIFIIIEKIIQAVRGVIFARMLGPSEYGVFNLAFFFIPLVVAVAKLGIPSCYVRYAPQYEKKGMLGDFLKKGYLLTIGAGIFFTIFSLIFSKQISILIYKSEDYNLIIILCAFTVIPCVMYENLIASFNGIRVFKMSTLLRFSQFFGFTVFGIVLVIFYPKTASIISANLLAFVLVLAVFGFIVWKYILHSESQNKKVHEDHFYSKIFKFSIWFTLIPIIDTLFHYTDRWMLNRFLGLEEVGIYSIAVNITGILFMFGMIAGNVLAPNLSRIWENGEKDRALSLINLSVKINIVFLLVIAVILSLFKQQFISILYGPVYIKSVSVLDMMMIFSILVSISLTLGVYPWLIEKPYIFVVNSSIGVIGNMVLNYVLIPRYHMEGAAIATTISFAISLLIMSFWLYKEGLRLKMATIFLCIAPGILVMDNMFKGTVFLILIAMILATDLIIDKNEKNILIEQLKKTILKYRKFWKRHAN